MIIEEGSSSTADEIIDKLPNFKPKLPSLSSRKEKLATVLYYLIGVIFPLGLIALFYQKSLFPTAQTEWYRLSFALNAFVASLTLLGLLALSMIITFLAMKFWHKYRRLSERKLNSVDGWILLTVLIAFISGWVPFYISLTSANTLFVKENKELISTVAALETFYEKNNHYPKRVPAVYVNGQKHKPGNLTLETNSNGNSYTVQSTTNRGVIKISNTGGRQISSYCQSSDPACVNDQYLLQESADLSRDLEIGITPDCVLDLKKTFRIEAGVGERETSTFSPLVNCKSSRLSSKL